MTLADIVGVMSGPDRVRIMKGNGNLLPPKENNKSDHTPGVQNLTPGKRTEGVTSKKLRKVARI